MEKNNINETGTKVDLEQKYENYIIKSIKYLQKYKDVKIIGKILYYLQKPVLYYICTVFCNTDINPFDIDIIFSFEFINFEIPYISITNDFIEPSLNDNRNYYKCLSKKYDYIFSLENLEEHIKIMDNIIIGIKNFLQCLNESLAINSFIFFGEYEYEHIYQINDFLAKKKKFNFFRINEILNNKREERYIIVSKLYFLIFKPLDNDFALAKIIFYQKLKDIKVYFDKNINNDTYILKLSATKYGKDIEFEMIERNINKEKEIHLMLNENNEENAIKILEFSKLIKACTSLSNIIDFNKYDLILDEYKILFNNNKSNFTIKDETSKKINEYAKCLEYYEKLLDLYNKLNSKSKIERINIIISNIIYLCSELLNYPKQGKENENMYLSKIRKYIEFQNK